MLRILAIAPYSHLKTRLDELAPNYPSIQLNTYVGDLDIGVKIAQKCCANYDLILSRGGTAQRLREAVRLPVVDIEISFLDILRIIKLVDIYHQKYAFIGFPNITKQILTLSEILDKPLDVISINNQSELPAILEHLKANNYSLIIGDNITAKSAQKMQLNSILIESGEESLTDGIHRAFLLGKQLEIEQQKHKAFIAAHNELGFSIYIFDKHLNLTTALIAAAQPNLTLPLKQYLSHNAFLAAATVDHLHIREDYYQLNIAQSDSHYFLFTKNVTSKFYQANYLIDLTKKPFVQTNSAVLIGESKDRIEIAATKHTSILITGESGTGKEKVLEILSAKILHRHKWLINFQVPLSSSDWKHLLTSPNSILLDTDAVFFISGADRLNSAQLLQLCGFIQTSSNLNSQWVISANPQSAQGLKNVNILQQQLSPYTIALQPLRQRREELSSIIGLYVYEFNHVNSENVLGFDPEAMQLLCTFSWPGNLHQLKRVIHQLVLESKTAFISVSAVKKALRRETDLAIENKNPLTLCRWEGQSLADIEYSVIQSALVRNHGNKTQTARQLDISRSTLWRILKQIEKTN